MMLGGGGFFVARLNDDQNTLLAFAGKVRERVKASEQVVAVDFGDDNQAAPEQAEADAPPAAPTASVVKPKDPPPPKVTKPEPPKPPEPEKKKVVVVEKKEETPKLPVLPKELEDKRIAVQQHVKKDQEDNPDAKQIAEDANKVEKETVASQTSTDQNDKNPAPGGNHTGPKDTVGNAQKTKIAESEEHPGEKERAPGEKGTQFDVQKDPPPKAMANQKVEGKESPMAPKSGGDGKVASAAAKAPKANDPPKETPASPEVHDSPNGGWTFNPLRPGVPAPGAVASSSGKTGDAAKGGENPSSTKWLGLGGKPGPGQVNLNLNHDGVIASVGVEQLRKERVADGERRLSQHRGSWQSSSLERWKSAIENYVATVQPGNQTALNAARSPFATYLNAMHLRIHPLFADSFLDSLDSLPPTHPLSDHKMWARLEIVLTRDGRVIKMGVVKPSGVTAFDIAALDSVQRASPFGPAPTAIISTDGNVYLHWDFHRDETACTTGHARPYLINVPGKGPTKEPDPPPPGKQPPGEDLRPTGAPDSRHGAP